MKRALILIIVLSIGTFGCGIWLDRLQTRTALKYLDGVETIRQSIWDNRMDDARREQAYWHAMWQHDSGWLNCLISHHHTRNVNAGMMAMATALEGGWQTESLEAVDETAVALLEIACSDLALWENIL